MVELTYFMKKKKDTSSLSSVDHDSAESLEHVFIVDFEVSENLFLQNECY